MTASQLRVPSSAARPPRASRSPRMSSSSGKRCGLLRPRLNRVTVCPRALRRLTIAGPKKPVPPSTRTCMRRSALANVQGDAIPKPTRLRLKTKALRLIAFLREISDEGGNPCKVRRSSLPVVAEQREKELGYRGVLRSDARQVDDGDVSGAARVPFGATEEFADHDVRIGGDG